MVYISNLVYLYKCQIKTNNILKYIDLDNENGLLKYGSQSWKINQEKIFLQIVPNLNLTFRYEALPLDNLIVNQIPSTNSYKCKSNNFEWLDCLESEIPLKIQDCQNSLNFSFSYLFNNDQFYTCTQIKPKQFTKTININCIYLKSC
jgi:hypothetical protein